jgi:hypothetical protein
MRRTGGDDMAEMDSATTAGLYEFLDWAGSKGELNLTTAGALKGAVGKILQVEDNPSSVDIRSLDVENVLGRFETRYRTGYTSGSMTTYKTRFRQAVAMYLAWLDKDPRWKTIVKNRRATDTAKGRGSVSTGASSSAASVTTPPQSAATNAFGSADATSRLVKHHLPLRPDLLVQIELPVHLTRADAERVAFFVKSLAFDDSPLTRDADDREQLAEGDI